MLFCERKISYCYAKLDQNHTNTIWLKLTFSYNKYMREKSTLLLLSMANKQYSIVFVSEWQLVSFHKPSNAYDDDVNFLSTSEYTRILIGK